MTSRNQIRGPIRTAARKRDHMLLPQSFGIERNHAVTTFPTVKFNSSNPLRCRMTSSSEPLSALPLSAVAPRGFRMFSFPAANSLNVIRIQAPIGPDILFDLFLVFLIFLLVEIRVPLYGTLKAPRIRKPHFFAVLLAPLLHVVCPIFLRCGKDSHPPHVAIRVAPSFRASLGIQWTPTRTNHTWRLAQCQPA